MDQYNSYSMVTRDLWQHKLPLHPWTQVGLLHKSLAPCYNYNISEIRAKIVALVIIIIFHFLAWIDRGIIPLHKHLLCSF